ncbi:hypothetical protein [Streptomyces sp. NBC_00557]|uniref:hypothetical protein n=1 Tax=Streptomyces sp. NBC_00557 TaxID=2975776 RepID=UPI002E80553D|nr:hypothetical protein [Streptomyces sp. NBC_00557]WUC39650.1 hypothetical protein OG956_38480 [Streptomyces sp. NBC_00557]
MRQDLAPAREIAARAMAATRQEMGISFQLTGSVALDLHGALRRGRQSLDGKPANLVDVNLTTPEDPGKYVPDRVVERIAGALQHSGWDAVVVAPVRPDHPISRAVQVSGRGLAEPVILTTTAMPEYTKPTTQYISGLAASPLPTLLLRAVQQVQLRRDPRDFIDLVAMEDAMGPSSVDFWVTNWLDRLARRNPDSDPARFYEALHHGLSRVMTVSATEMSAHGLGRPELTAVQDRIVRLAGRIAERVPRGEGRPSSGLQRLLSMSDEELARMHAAALALGITANEVERRVTSPASMAEQRRQAELDILAAVAEKRRRTLDSEESGAHQQGPSGPGVRRPMN